jgi:5-methylcytosine-specific restriction endonuclease McrA
MIQQRKGRIPKTKEELDRTIKGLCAICGNPLPNKRRKTFCSKQCEHVWWSTHDWGYLRSIILERDSYKCAECGLQLKRAESGYFDVVNDPKGFTKDDPDRWGEKGKDNSYYYLPLIVDHIKPIALGGGEFDRDNLQVLCKWCDKAKTKNDIGNIVEFRRIEKVIGSQGKSLLEFNMRDEP